MKVTNISCEQFAGVQNRDVSLQGGINVIYGKNETGKSTLVNLLSRTLFQKAKIDGRSDKDFPNLYYPGDKKNGTFKGDFADGKVTFETDKGTYTLKKEWGKDARCKLSMPNGDTLRNQSDIDKALRDALQYSEGVYNDMLFSSQRNTDMALQTILDATKKTDAKQQITDAVSQAFAESDGISIDAIEQKINKRIEEIGKNWDSERQRPTLTTTGKKRDNGLGEVAKAYNDLETAQNELYDIGELEKRVGKANGEYNEAEKAFDEADKKYQDFLKHYHTLKNQKAQEQLIEKDRKELKDMEEALRYWPGFAQSLKAAEGLKAEKEHRNILDNYAKAAEIESKISVLQEGYAGRSCPTDAEIRQVERNQKDIWNQGNKLCAMNITAAISMFGEHSIEIISMRTGERIDLSGGLASLKEAAKISIPGVMEMQLYPKDVNVDEINAQIDKCNEEIKGIFLKYNVGSLDDLKKLAKKIKEDNANLETAKGKLDMLLEKAKYSSYDELKVAAEAIAAPARSSDDIDSAIHELCGNTDISEFIGGNNGTIGTYRFKYGSIDQLRKDIEAKQNEIKEDEKALPNESNIPAEYRNITNLEGYRDKLKEERDSQQKLKETAKESKDKAEGKLEDYDKAAAEAKAEDAERDLNEKKELLNHWQHIKEVFDGLKADMHNNPMEDIAKSLTKYLGLISGGKVSGEFPDQSKLDMKIYSGNNLLDYSKLSEGTKETVSLAFRLAVLDHLFPEGGGIIVFDDPLTDMDAERAEQSCRLIKECAKRHQVIFLTCREDYIDQLGGNLIRF